MQAVPSHPGQSGVFVPGKGRRQTVTVEVRKEVRSAAAPQPKYSADESNVFSYKRKYVSVFALLRFRQNLLRHCPFYSFLVLLGLFEISMPRRIGSATISRVTKNSKHNLATHGRLGLYPFPCMHICIVQLVLKH